MCVTGSLLAAVGKYVYEVWEIYFPCHMNILFHGSLTGYAHFHGAPPATPAQVLQVAPHSLLTAMARAGAAHGTSFHALFPPLLWLSPHTYPFGFLIFLLSIAFFVCRKKQDCKSAAAGTVGMCVTGSLLAAVGKYVYEVWEIYFPCHMNILFHGSLTGYAHFHGAPSRNASPRCYK